MQYEAQSRSQTCKWGRLTTHHVNTTVCVRVIKPGWIPDLLELQLALQAWSVMYVCTQVVLIHFQNISSVTAAFQNRQGTFLIPENVRFATQCHVTCLANVSVLNVAI